MGGKKGGGEGHSCPLSPTHFLVPSGASGEDSVTYIMTPSLYMM